MFRTLQLVLLLVILTLPAALKAATITISSSGLWYQTSTWPGGSLPTENDDVIVPSGMTLTMAGICRAKTITVHGTLKGVNWQPGGAWIDLRAHGIVVENGGLMEIGTEAQPYHATDRCVITLTGNKTTSPGGSYKGIMVKSGGDLELHGKVRKSWTNLGATANAGATQITLKEAVDWEVGDIIALTSTDLASAGGDEWEHVDEVEITSISGDSKTLTLQSPLQYKHLGESKTYSRASDSKTWDVAIEGEVGLLSHYIKIQGDMSGTNEADGFGGHIMLMPGSMAHVEHVELYKMGQKGELGRYPFHWHLNEDMAYGSYFKNSSVHRSFNRAVTIHGTDSVTVDGIFAYDHIGHGIFLEDGGERFNTIKNNVVFVTRRPNAGDELTDSDNELNQAQNRTPASFWITNPNNYFENNVAAGTEGTGFWIALPTSPMGPSGSISHFDGINPTTEPLGKFEGFVAHTCMNGWDVFDQLNPDHSIKKNFGWNINTDQYFDDGLFYGNETALYCGLGNGGDPSKVVYRNCVFSDNQITTMLAADLKIQNSLFVGDSDLGVFTGDREFFRFYDGPGQHIDCHFEAWNRSYTYMVRQNVGGGATENFNPSFTGTTKGFYEPFNFRYVPLPSNAEARKVGQFFKDYDGGLTGKAHTTIIRDIPFLTDGHEYRHPSWRNAARSDYYFAGLWLHAIGNDVDMSVTRSKSGTSDVCFFEPAAATSGTTKFPLIVNEDFEYTYRFSKAPDTKKVQLIWYRGDVDDETLVRFKGLGKLGNFRVNGHQFTILNPSTEQGVRDASDNAYYINPSSGDVFLKLVADGGDTRVNIFFNWDNNGTYTNPGLSCTSSELEGVTALDTDGDSRSDVFEQENCGLVNNASDLNFGFNGSTESFTMNQIAAHNVNSGTDWLLRADNANDPYIVRDGLYFSGSQVTELNIRAKSQAAGAFTVYWATTTQTGFSAARSVTVAPAQTNVYEELTFDMSSFSSWTGETITKIRLDFPPDASSNVHTYIDYIHGPNASDGPCPNQSPSVSVTSPGNGATFTVGQNVTITANSDDSDGWITKVDFYSNGNLISTDTESPYSITTSFASQGSYNLKAKATDNDGAFTESATINITIANSDADVDGDGLTQTEESSVCMSDSDAGDFSYDFTSSNQGFLDTHHISAYAFTVAGEYLMRVDNLNDPYIVKDSLNFDADEVSSIVIRGKTQVTGGQFQLFWATASSPNFSANKSITSGTVTGSLQDFTFDVGSHSEWQNETITKLRIDLPVDASGSYHTWIDYVRAQDFVEDACSGSRTANANSEDEVILNEQFILFPNPAKDFLNVAFANDEMKNAEVNIFDLSGKMVHSQILNDSKTINIKSLKTGTYLLKLVHNNKTHVERFIKN
ncbi:G8 domain-containing protein [Marinoscillum furvescens]|uniref:Putative secreted protein (Por secretion system target) n=1 Tax=Marinoscillum furvescens DSM 4134 TaxID=1122208 RepID=A0A3D9L2U9_MARFU|nr:G8 domain-containing protein [Marinoscillum furvescens]RED98336.1 putative secreted protein (Por secretion system target) [Marinoscillum furvescens DSM 4134]